MKILNNVILWNFIFEANRMFLRDISKGIEEIKRRKYFIVSTDDSKQKTQLIKAYKTVILMFFFIYHYTSLNKNNKICITHMVIKCSYFFITLCTIV